MRTTILAILGCLFASHVSAQAIRNDFGLTNPAITITFDEIALPVDTQVRDQYAEFGVTFEVGGGFLGLIYAPQQGVWPGVTGSGLGNFPSTVGLAVGSLAISFIEPQTRATFGLATDARATTFTAYLAGQAVAQFTADTSRLSIERNPAAFFGFEGTLFDRIVISPINRPDLSDWQPALIDNLQFGSSVTPAPQPDFDRDGQVDLVGQHPRGDVMTWLLNGTSMKEQVSLFSGSTAWQVVATGDFNGDGHTDVVGQHPSGSAALWLLEGTTFVGTHPLPDAPAGWRIVGSGHFSHDEHLDLVWQDSTGAVVVWLMSGLTKFAEVNLHVPETEWRVVGIGDFNADRRSDLLWQAPYGVVHAWLMSGTSVLEGRVINADETNWRVAGVGDYNADAQADVLWQHPDGAISAWFMDGTTRVRTERVRRGATTWKVIAK